MAGSLVRGARNLVKSNSLLAFANASPSLSLSWQQKRQKSDELMRLKHGRGGRSSFTGNVVTVFGASGFVGRHIVNRLAKEGTQVIIPYRGDFYDVQHLKVAGDLGQILFLTYDPRDYGSILKCLKYSNWAINLIGREYQTKNYNFHQVHVDVARNIARACKEAGVEKLLHFSALGASPDPPRALPKIPKPLTKTAAFLPGGSEFLRSKYFGEIAVREEFPEVIIFRPADIMGHTDKFLRYWSSVWRRNFWGYIALHKKGESSVKAPIYIADVVTAGVHALKSKHIHSQTFQCPGPYFYRLSDLIDYFLECLNFHEVKRIRLFWNPNSWSVILICSAMEVFAFSRPLMTWEKIERESIPDMLVSEYPMISATLPEGYQLTPVEKVAPYDLNMSRRANYYISWMSVPHPDPPRPLAFDGP